MNINSEQTEKLRTQSDETLSPIIGIKNIEIYRLNSVFNKGKSWTFKNKIELSKINFLDENENGIMMYQEVKFKPMLTKLFFIIRYTITPKATIVQSTLMKMK